MPEKRILIIHPYDKTTAFLDKIKNHLQDKIEDDIHYYSVKPNDNSHSQCLERISSNPSSGLIIFLGHGHSERLSGSKGDLFDSIEFVSPEAIDEDPDSYYFNYNFINENNINVFSGKKVFCLACNSNDNIGYYAVEKGAKTFLGFGDIPTSRGEFELKYSNVSKDLITRMKLELTYIIKTSLILSIIKGLTFNELLNFIYFITNQRIADILINQKKFRDRYILTDQLYNLKKEAKIFGDPNIKLIE